MIDLQSYRNLYWWLLAFIITIVYTWLLKISKSLIIDKLQSRKWTNTLIIVFICYV